LIAFFAIREIFSQFKGGAWPKWPNGKYAYDGGNWTDDVNDWRESSTPQQQQSAAIDNKIDATSVHRLI